MGSQFDYSTIYGDLSDDDIRKEFESTIKDREYDHGHSGYSGTMAEAYPNSLEFYSETFQNEEEALEHLRTHTGKQNPKGFLELFSSKNHTNCARFPGGAVFGGDYSY